MEKFQSLAEYLGTAPAVGPADAAARAPQLEDISNAREFALAVLDSRDFRLYIVNCLTLGNIPPAVLCRLMDYAWGKPADRVEHTGKDGQPIELISEVRRVIVRAGEQEAVEVSSESVH